MTTKGAKARMVVELKDIKTLIEETVNKYQAKEV